MSTVTRWHSDLLFLPIVPPCFLLAISCRLWVLCRAPVEPGAGQTAGLIILARVPLDLGEKKREDVAGRQAEAWAGLFAV